MTVLFSPEGPSYGTLDSKILLTRPNRVVIGTRAEAVLNLATARDEARFYIHLGRKPMFWAIMQAGFSEGRALALGSIQGAEEPRRLRD